MHIIVIGIHVAACVALILIVLLQRGKGADMGAAFGGSSQTVFGSAGATSFLSKITIAAATLFILTSLFLAFQFGKGKPSSIMKGVKTEAPVTQPGTASTAPAPEEGNQ